MLRYKQSAAARIPVRLRSAATGAPLPGVLYSAVTVAVQKANGTQSVFTVTDPDWATLTTGAFSGSGNYDLILPDSLLDQVGPLRIAIAASGALEVETIVVQVVSYTEAELVSAIAAVASSVSDLQASIGRILQVQVGKSVIATEGDDANRQVLYDEDGTTPLYKWDLKDDAGEPTVGPNILQRVPVDLGGGD